MSGGNGNGIVSAKRRAQARKHADRSVTCMCGKVCHGNGGISGHKKACPVRAAAFADKATGSAS